MDQIERVRQLSEQLRVAADELATLYGPIYHERDGLRRQVEALRGALGETQATVRRMHRALSEGYGVEDGGVWEDRALAAEAEREQLQRALAACASAVKCSEPWTERLAAEVDAALGRASAVERDGVG